MRYTKIPENAFKELQLNAGVILSTFDPAEPAFENSAIIGATTGGVNFSAVPSFSDFGEDIDNAPRNVKELKQFELWDINMSGTFITITPNSIKRSVGVADVDEEDPTHIIPRSILDDADFQDIWWVGDYSDKNDEENGGFVAIHMMNALSTSGFTLQSSDRAKGQFAFEFTAHYSIADQTVVPFEVFVRAGA